MKLYHLVLINLLLFSNLPCHGQGDSFVKKYSSDSAFGILDIGEDIRSRKDVDEETWERVFDTEGYRKYLATSRRDVLRSMLKAATELAFSPDKDAEVDSVLLLTPDASDYQTLMTQNMCKLAKRHDEARRFMEETDFPELLSKADRLVKKYLPKRAVLGEVTLNDLYLICTIPDASVRDHSVLLDLNLAMDMTEEEIVRLLAHEFFHNYRETALTDEPGNSFWKIFNCFENEGIADLIDKGEHPEAMYTRYGASFESLYLHEYQNSSKTLQKLDSLLSVYQVNPVKGEYAPVADLLVFNGHPTGYYMARLICEEGLQKELIEAFDNPATFAELYNEAAFRRNKRGGQEYLLSKEMVRYLHQVK